MKKVVLTLAQFVIFLAVFAVGSFLHPWNMHWAEKTAPTGATTFFIADGLLTAVGLFLATLLVQVLRKKTRNMGWTTLAFALAIAFGYFIRLGFITRDL